MNQNVREHIMSLLLSIRRHRQWIVTFVVAALLVSMAVTGLLKQSGLAATDQETVFGYHNAEDDAHTHSEDCYDEDGNLVCTLEEQEQGEPAAANSDTPETTSTTNVPEDEPAPMVELEPEDEPESAETPEPLAQDEPSPETESDTTPSNEPTEAEPNEPAPSEPTDHGPHELTLTQETDDLTVEATITDGAPIPEQASLVVTPITPDMDCFDSYMQALNRDYDSDVYTSANALLYDVTVMAGGEKFEPTDGRVDITLDFKSNQLSEDLGLPVEDESAIRVIHLPVEPSAQPAVSDIDDALDPDDIAVEYVTDAELETGDTEKLTFSLDSLSVITVTGATTDVTVNAALMGTDMQSLGYNLYAYLLANNDNTAYGAKVSFTGGNATATIPNVPANTYKLYLVYARDNRELQERWNYGNVLDANTNNWVDADGGYIFGYSARMPADKTITPQDNTIGFGLEVTDAQSSISVDTIMDRAINYGIVAEDIKYNVRSYTNFATKHIDISNSNDSTIYSSRANGVDVVPNIIADIDHNGQPMSTQDKPANYYVTEDDKNKVSSANQEDTIIRNQNEIADRVELMLNNTLRQCESLKQSSMLTLPSTTMVDVSPYGDNATIILDATAISGEQNGFTIVKRPGQTVVFNINGQNAAPPQNVKVKLVDKTGQQVDIDGNPSTKTYVAGDDMRNAAAKEGKVWSSIVWNFPDATSVTATNQCGGIYLVPKGDFTAANKGGGWIVARGKVSVTNEWYGFPGSDEPFKQKIIRKTFVGIGEGEIDPNYALKLYTHVNDSTSGTTDEQLITSLVLKPSDDESLVYDPTGVNDQTGYMTKGTDEEGNVFYEWKTPPLSVGNEHALHEVKSTSVGTPPRPVELIEFVGPFSEWNNVTQNYEWVSRTFEYASEEEFDGVFNVSSHNEDYRQYVYVTNNYRVDKTPNDLTLAKTVVDPEGIEPAGQEYTFEITLADENGAPLTGEVTYTLNGGAQQTATLADGVLSLQLAKDDTVKLLQLPYGTRYTIRETEVPAKCEVAFSGDTNSKNEGVGRLIKDRSVTATNTYSDDPGVPITAHKDLIDGVLHDGQFTYRLVDANGQLVKQATNDANGNISFGTLVFDADGEYDFTLYEVADPSQTDIIFDTSEFGVHVRVEGGRVREVTYTTELGTTATTPMFRNRQIPTDSDTLTARKIFIDNVTGKAVRLAGGEFTFTATSAAGEGEEPIVYTGTNDADGMVTFHDGAGNVVDLDTLTQPETFTIAETSGSYTGTVPAGYELTYDEGTHQATAVVETETVTRNPWTTEQVSADTTNLTLTFTPSDTSGSKYYIGLPFGPVSSEIRSDGTVSFTIGISKVSLTRDNAYHSYSVEYGKGDNIYWDGGHQALGQVTFTAKAGEWGQEPVEIGSVSVDGSPLSPTQEIMKTVKLVYAEGHYPVFVNTLDATEPDTKTFPFTKVWVDNVTYANPQDWQVGTQITLHLTGTFVPEGQVSGTSTSSYEFKIRGVEDTQGELAFEFTQPTGADAPQIKVSDVSGGVGHYGFVIEGLPDADTVGGADGHWSYHLTEDAIEGYSVSYGAWDESEQKAVPNPEIASQGIAESGYLINAKVMVELPSCGGPGSGVYTIAGVALVVVGLLIGRMKLANSE